MDSDKKKKEKKHKTFDPSKYVETEPTVNEEDQLDEVLTIAQRRQRGRVMKRFASRNARRREVAKRRKASNEKLKARALKRARNIIKARLAGQKKYSELEPAQKIQVDKRLAKISPARIQTLAKKQLPVVRTKEMERLKKMRSTNEDLDLSFEQFLEENYYTGLDTETKEKRKAHFERGAAMDDDNPAAYTPAPGDEDAETKPSTHTKRYHRMFKKEGTVNCDRRFKIFRKKENEYFTEQFIEDAADLMEAVDAVYENKEIIQKKSDETGIPHRILKQVFDRGVAAWRTGHRPGTTPAQWGVARINSFATGGKTQKTTDSDLWAEYKGKKESVDLDESFEERFLSESSILDKALAAIHKYVTQGAELSNVAFEVSRAAGVGKTSRELEREYIARYGQPATATVNGSSLRKKYGFKEAAETEFEMGDYKTSNFHICPSAKSAFEKNRDAGIDENKIIAAAKAVDKYLGIEKDLRDRETVTEQDFDQMEDAVEIARNEIAKAGLKGHNYHDIHVDNVREMINEGTDSSDPHNREEGTDSLVKIYKSDTPGEKNEEYNDSNIASEYGLFDKGDRVSFSAHSMDFNDNETREGTVTGSTVSFLKVRTDDGKLYKVRHHDASLVDEA